MNKLPMIFLLQPTYKECKTPDEIKHWEKLMADKVGFKPDFIKKDAVHTMSTSQCGGTDDDCDLL